MSDSYTINPPQEPVGRYRLADNISIAMHHKPNRFHRLMVRLVLGWEWIDG